MSTFRSESGSRSSRAVITPLLIVAGAIGLPLAILQCSRDDDDKRETAGAPPTVDAGQSYPNNHFLPGAGYYHSPFHAWFPFPYNHFVGGQGYYRGGQWRPAATPDAQENAALSRFGGTFPRSAPGSVEDLRLAASRPTTEAVSQANAAAATHFRSSVTRGGFGQSSRPSFS